MSKFNDRLKELLKEQNITQSELSRRSGISRSTIADYITRGATPSYDKLTNIARALGVSTEYLNGTIDIKTMDDQYIDYLVSEYQDLEDLIKDINPSTMKILKKVIEVNSEYEKFHDNPFKELLDILTQMNELDLKDLRAYAKYRLDNPR